MGKLGELLAHPDEFLPMVRIYFASKRASKLPSDPKLAFCYDILNSVSRSFAIVIQQLPNPLRDAICVFYLVLRGLDTVEDDMALADDIKLPALRSFHEKIYERGFSMECGTNHYQRLMKEFGIVVDVFLGLDPVFKEVIADITRRMGHGMADFIEKEVVSVKEYDLYCHYVAGLVGIGLSQLFASSGLESQEFGRMEDLANHMGLFLQKTNIIRDYLEDIMEEPAPRMFWPREIWGRYAEELADFKEPHNREQALRCLNHMIVNALGHLPHCVKYMRQLRDVMVFRFCAIPQIMAAGTLALCFNNGKVFEGVVKMRRGQTAKVFDSCSNMGDLFRWFVAFLEELDTKVDAAMAESDDPILAQAKKAVSTNLDLCRGGLDQYEASTRGPAALGWIRDYVALTAAGTYAYYAFGMGSAPLVAPEPLQSVVQAVRLGQPEAQLIHFLLAALLLALTLRAAVMSPR